MSMLSANAHRVLFTDPACEVCDGVEDLRRAPLMTRVPFDAPASEQRYVCSACFLAWYEGGGTSRESIRKARGLPCDKFDEAARAGNVGEKP